MAEITYIWHDCFVVKTDSATLLFDYWLDPKQREGALYPDFLDDIDPELPLYLFVSHSHKDHFNPEIFSWGARFPKIHYILSKDVWRRCRHVFSVTSVYSGPKVSAEAVTMLDTLDMYEDSVIHAIAFPSTDVGNSYMVEVKEREELRVFHAGDLNAWVWFGDSTEQEIRKGMGDFNACLLPIESYLDAAVAAGGRKEIDIMFFPVDSRLSGEYYTGAKQMVRRFDVKKFFPMHFGLGAPEEQKRFERDALRFDLYKNEVRGEYIALFEPYKTVSC